MQIITLLTDMGLNDYYVAALKGRILNLAPNATIIDITHDVKPFDIGNASFYLNAAFREFPKGTIHINGVDSEPVIHSSQGAYPAIMLYEGHYFVGNDNGFFSLILKENQPEGFWFIDDVLSNPKGFRFPTKNIFVPTAVRIANGEPVTNFASVQETWQRALLVNPVLEEHVIKGSIIHIDHYGNAITNISKELFDRFNDEPFRINFRKRDYVINVISNTYNDVPPGERLAFFNDSNLLEIAINKGATGSGGGAETLFGLHLNDTIRIEFSPRGSATTIDSIF